MFRRTDPRPAGIVPDGEEVLPGYTVVGLLAHGKRIDTYDVWSELRECRCVVKRLRPDRLDEPRVRAAVQLEARLLTTLTHPHLVRGYEAYEDPVPAMVLETLGGATLAAVIDRAPLGVQDVAMLGLQLSSVLGYLHRQGWLHLDIKPANVIVENGRATLLDLSLVGRPGRGRPGAGTRGYLSPEQALGESLAPASDVWGLGVTLVEALTAEMPHGDEATWDSKRRIPVLHRRPPAPLAPLPGVPTALDDLLRGCLERVPERRPTLAEVRRVLADYASEDVKSAGRPDDRPI